MLNTAWAGSRRLLNKKFLVYTGVAVLAFFLYFWRLDSLTKGLSLAEISARSSSSSLSAIVDNPLNAPHHLLQYLFTHLGGNSAFYLRLPSAILALLLMWSFYYLVRTWFGKIIGALSTIVAASSPLVILSARSATPEILLLSSLAVLATYTWLKRTKTKKDAAWIILCVLAAGIIYVPGGLWLLIFSLVFGRNLLERVLSKVNSHYKVLGIFLALLIIAPLFYGLFKHPGLIRPLLLIPGDWPFVVDILKQFGWAISALILRAPSHIDLIIARLPVLDATQIVLLIFGIYAMGRLARAKSYSLASLIILALVASSINHNITYLMLGLPAIFVFVAAGLRYLFVEWRTVFPRNPIPKYLALSLMSLLVILHAAYGLNYSLSAWPNTDSTKNVYVLK